MLIDEGRVNLWKRFKKVSNRDSLLGNLIQLDKFIDFQYFLLVFLLFWEYAWQICVLQVCDIMIHRYLELPPVSKSLEILLDHLGCLYKFHGKYFSNSIIYSVYVEYST